MCACRTKLSRIPRRVDYVHMPIVPKPDSAFLAPLRDLNVGGARVFLGNLEAPISVLVLLRDT